MAAQLQFAFTRINSLVKAIFFCSLFFFSLTSFATIYDIGPGQTYTTINSFPWYTLAAGDSVQIHYATYHEFINISTSGTATQPIRVIGIPDPSTGAQPVIDGQNAVVGPNAHFQYTHGTPSRGVVGIGPSAGAPVGFKPSYIEISGLTIMNAYGGTNPYSFTDANGTTGTYSIQAAAIYLLLGNHIVITNCTLTGSSNGLFVQSGDLPTGGTEAEQSRDITLQYSRVYANGNPGSQSQHEIYTEAIGMVFQYNYLGSPIATSGGSNLKDRSAGTVIRYNWIESGAHMLDLVDPEGSVNIAVPDPTFQYTYVYGNVFYNTTTTTMVHYGGDHNKPANDRKGTLYFYNNTVVVRADSGKLYQSVMLQLGDNGSNPPDNTQLADVRNNIFYTTNATAGQLSPTFDITSGYGVATLYANWISKNWQDSYNTPSSPSVVGDSNLFVDSSNNPSFSNPGALYFNLLSGSNAIDKGVALAAATTSNPAGQTYTVTRQYVKDETSQARQVNGTALDFGAFESGSAGPCGYTFYPASSSPSYPGGNATMEVAADLGCSWTSSPNASWLSVVSGGSGTGAAGKMGTLQYNVQSNTGIARTSSLTIGGQAFTVSQLVYDATPPTVSITSPANGTAVSGSAVNLTATASDNVAVASVQFTVDGSLVGPAITASPYAMMWDSTSVAPGNHSVSAIATDTAGNTATASPITVTVSTSTSGTATNSTGPVFVSSYLTSTQTGTFTFQGDVTPVGDSTTTPTENGLFALSNGPATILQNLATIALFDTDGVIRVRNGGAYANTTAVTYIAGHTYHVRMVVNIPAHTYDVYVTPSGGSEVQIASAYAFRSEQASVTQLDHWDLVAEGNGIRVSNVMVTGTGQTAAPTFTPAAGTYTSTQTVTISTTTPSATIYYTTNGTTPTASSTVYSSPVSVSSTQTLQAIATASGYSTSAVGSAAYTISPLAATPTFSPVGGTYTSTQTVTISTTTPSATIYYTINGTTPTTGSTVYAGSITVSATETVKAIATASGYSTSAVGSAAYTISASSPPAFTQQCNATNGFGTSISCTVSGVGAGHTLVIGISAAGTAITSVTSTTGTPVSVVSDGALLKAYILSNTTAGSITITGNVASNSKIWLSVAEYSNTAASPLDGSASGACTAYCTSVSSASFNTTSGSDQLWSFCSGPGGGVITAGTAPITWTARPSPTTSSLPMFMEDGLAGAAGSYYGQCTGSSGGATDIITLALKHP